LLFDFCTPHRSIDPVTGNITVISDTVPINVTIAVADSAGDVSAGKRVRLIDAHSLWSDSDHDE
jgi:hypothetical protein